MATTDFVVKNGLVVNEDALIRDTTNSTSTATGALVVNGGVGVANSLYVGGAVNLQNNLVLVGDLEIQGGDLTTNQATFNLLNTTATTLNIGGSATTLSIGAATGTATINNANTVVTGDLEVRGGDLTTNQATFNLLNATATAVNAFGAATTLELGAATGTTNINNNLDVDGDVNIDGGDLTVSTATFNLANTTATTVNAFGAATTLELGAATGTTNINNNLDVDGDVNIDGGDLTVSTTTFNLANTTATTLNIGGAATTLELGAPTGTTNINNNLDVDGDVNIDGGDLTVSTATFNLANTTATTLNIGGAATTLSLGAVTGTATINNANTVVTGDLEVRGGDLTTNQTTFNLLNATATTLNVGSAASTARLGATTGTLTLGNPTVIGTSTTQNLYNTVATTVNAFGAATTLELGAATGTTNINNNLDVDGDVNIDGGDLTVSTATFNLANTTATTLNIGGAATTLSIGAATGTATINNANTVVTGDLSVNGGDLTTTQTTFNLLNATATAVNAFGAATTLELGAATGTTNINNNLDVDGDVNIDGGDLTVSTTTFNLATTNATTVNAFSAATTLELGAATGTTNINNNLDVDGDVNIDGGDLTVSTTTFNLANTVATTLNVGSAASTARLGATTGTLTLGNPTVIGTSTTQNLYNTVATTLNIGGAATTLSIGAATGTATINNANTVVVGDLEVRGGDLTTNQTTFNLLNATATTINFGSSTTALSIGAATGTATVRNASVVLNGDLEVQGGDLTTNQTTFNLLNATATTLNIGGAATTLSIGAATGTTTVNNGLTVTGNLTVNGTTTTVNSTTLTVDDINIELGSTAAPTDATANGGGITLRGTSDKTITWLDATDRWTFNQGIEASGVENTPIGGTSRSSGAFTSLTANAAVTLTQGTASTSTATGTLVVTGGVGVSGAVFANTLNSTVATGTAPFTVASTTLVTNLNADLLDGLTTATANTANTVVARGTNGDFSAGTITASLSGNATTASSTPNPTFSADAVVKDNLTTRTETGFYESSTGTLAEGWPTDSAGWHHLIAATHSNDSNYYSMQLSSTFFDQNLYFRATNGSGTTAWSKVWTDANDGSGSGLDADTLDGISSASFVQTTTNQSISGIKTFTNNTGSTSTTSGTVVVTGGVGISENLYVGGTLNATNLAYTGTTTSSVSTISGAGSVQGDATAITTDLVLISTVAVGTGVRLPVANVGKRIVVRNNGLNDVRIYPAVSAQINTLGLNTAFVMGPATTLEFIGFSTNQWYTVNATFA